MLKELYIQNVILVEEARIDFETGFTVISGETGSGKSAIMEALALALGARGDVDLIRHGAESATIEAIFDLSENEPCMAFLANKGIEIESCGKLILKRILSSTKSRAYINHSAAQLSLLKELSVFLIEIVSQHATHKLFQIDQHRELVDLYGDLTPLRKEYELTYQRLQEVRASLKMLQHKLSSSAREIEICEREILEIKEAALKPFEEEELFESYSLLSSSSERQDAANHLELVLGSEKGVLAALNRTKGAYQTLIQKDPTISLEISLYPQIVLEVEELLHSIRKYSSRLDANPEKLVTINERLTLINRMKKKYGPTIEEINAYAKNQEKHLETLLGLEEDVQDTIEKEKKALVDLKKIAEKLTKKRKNTALLLSKEMTKELAQLNMEHAQLNIEITEIEPTLNGSDKVEFFLHSNVGEKPIPLKDGASGGEIARVLLALHILLAGKEAIGTLIFDEIDANIGGTTASLIGEKLKLLGQKLQVISITHFPQVAKSAEHHIQIQKKVENGRTFSNIATLTLESRNVELERMVGKG